MSERFVRLRTAAVGAMTALALAWAGPAMALQGTIVVKGPAGTCGNAGNPYNVAANGGWALSPSMGSSYNFVAGPLAPPAGAGSLQESVAAAGPVVAAVNINPNFAGQSLGAVSLVLAGISYANLDIATFTGNLPAFVIFVDLDNNGTTDDQVLYFPVVNGCAGFGMWTTCSPLPSSSVPMPSGGIFYNANPVAAPNGPGNPFYLDQYLAANGGAKLPAYPNPAIGILLGVGPVFGAATAYADNLILDGQGPLSGPFDDIQFDFEADCSAYGGDADGDCYCDSASPLVLIKDQCPGVDDRFDAAPPDGNVDTDGDNVYECRDTCPFTADPTNADGDGDGVGDVCDNCPAVSNAGQADGDGDGTGDACDLCPADPGKIAPGQCGCGNADTDTDSDGVADCIDNCVNTPNPGQEDLDNDGDGNACDPSDAGGLSLRRAQINKSPSAGRDRWSAQAEIDTNAVSPTFLADADANGLTLSIASTNPTVSTIDTETWTGADCKRVGANQNGLRCKNALGSQLRFAKRPSPGFFRVVASVRNQSIPTLPALSMTPLQVSVTSTPAVDQVDTVDSCAVKANRLICKETP
jgi:hypothetical protein